MLPRLAAWCSTPLKCAAALLLATLLQPGSAAVHAPVVTKAPALEAGSVRFTHSYGWLPFDARRLVLWAGIEEPYLVEIAPGCGDLRQAPVSGLTTHNRRLSPRTDSLVVNGAPCPVQRIEPATGATLNSLGLRREDARAVPILPSPPTPPPRNTP